MWGIYSSVRALGAHIHESCLPTLEKQRVKADTDADPTKFLESTATYDTFGRILTAKGPAETANGTQVSWSYTDDNPSDGLRHIAVTNQAGWVTHQWVEPAFGNVVKTQDANGDYTHYKYDAGGLLTAGWANRAGVTLTSTPPAGTVAPTVYYGYDVYGSPLSVRTKPVAVLSAQFAGLNAAGAPVSVTQASTVRRSYEFLDGFGRTVETHTVAPDGSGKRLVSQIAFDDVGRVVRVSEPYYDSSKPAQVSSGLKAGVWSTVPRYTETTYDPAGRVDTTTLKVIVNSTQQSLPLTDVDYGLDWTLTKSLTTGASTLVNMDTLGRTVSQLQYPETGHGTTPITTTYAYPVAAAGPWVQVTDDDNKVTTFKSDLAGRRTELIDPNSGTSTYTYNAKGQVSQIASATGTVNFTYDALGRMTARSSVDANSNVSSSAQWVYDLSGHKGALASETATTVTPAGSFPVVKTFAYNTLHQLTGTTVSLPQTSLLGELSDEDYSTTVAYDGTGAATTVTHDAIGGLPVQTVTTGLDKLGRVRTLTVADAAGSRKVVTGTTFDQLGRLSSRSFGNGVVRQYGWDAKWGSLATVSASFNAGADVVQADAYGRDSAGRVVSVLDAVSAITQCYTYDGHNRLETAWTDTDWQAPCATGPELATQPSGDEADLAFAVGYEYLPTGQVDSITNLLTQVVSQFAYTDTSSPNAVTSVTDGTTTDVFTYDTAGRMVTRTVNSVSTDLVWDASSNLVATSGQGGDIVYLYDAGGQRVAQISVGDLDNPAPVSATAYFGATEVTDPNTATTDEMNVTRYFTFGGSTVATATSTAGAAPEWALLFGDIQGSAQVMMELVADTGVAAGFAPASSAHTVTRDAYMPYGAERGTGDLPIDRGWLGQVEDTSTGLTYLNARYYDPAIGRFLSPDPLMNPGDPRTLDPYRYADNNPVVYTDATGLAPSCSGLTGDAYTMCNDYSKNTYNYSTGKTVVQNNIDKAKGKSAIVPKPSGGSKAPSGGVVAAIEVQVAHWSDHIAKSYVNYWGGMVNGASSSANFGLQTSGGGMLYQAITGRRTSQFGTVGIWGDYETYRWNSYMGSAGFEAVGFFATGGGGAVKSTVIGAAKIFTGARAARSMSEIGNGLRTAGRACYSSFSASTKVLMADGSYKPISAIVVGDMVMAHDPETGEKGAREVTHVWVHQDALVNLEIDGGTVTTTSDHPFWNATDAQWQDAGVLDAGDMVLTSTGDLIPVAGVLHNSWHIGTAYNLTVDDIHTYYVGVADTDVLVHNAGCDSIVPDLMSLPAKPSNPNIRYGGSSSDVQTLLNTWMDGATPIGSRGGTPWFANADGVQFGTHISRTDGLLTIDVRVPGTGKPFKVHVTPGMQ